MNNKTQALYYNVEGEEQKEFFDKIILIIEEYIDLTEIEENIITFKNLRDIKRFIIRNKYVLIKDIEEKTNFSFHDYGNNIDGFLNGILSFIGYGNLNFRNQIIANFKDEVERALCNIGEKKNEKNNGGNFNLTKQVSDTLIIFEKENLDLIKTLKPKEFNIILNISKQSNEKILKIIPELIWSLNTLRDYKEEYKNNINKFLCEVDSTLINHLGGFQIRYILKMGITKEYMYLLKYTNFIKIYQEVGIEKFDKLYKKVGKKSFLVMSQFHIVNKVFGYDDDSNLKKIRIDYIISNGIEEKYFNTLYGISNLDIKKYYEKVGIDLIYETQYFTSRYLGSIFEKIGHENLKNYSNKLFIILKLLGEYGGGQDSFLELDFSNTKLISLINNLDIEHKIYVVFPKFYKYEGNKILLNNYLDGRLTKGFFKKREYSEDEFIDRIYEFVGN